MFSIEHVTYVRFQSIHSFTNSILHVGYRTYKANAAHHEVASVDHAIDAVLEAGGRL